MHCGSILHKKANRLLYLMWNKRDTIQQNRTKQNKQHNVLNEKRKQKQLAKERKKRDAKMCMCANIDCELTGAFILFYVLYAEILCVCMCCVHMGFQEWIETRKGKKINKWKSKRAKV